MTQDTPKDTSEDRAESEVAAPEAASAKAPASVRNLRMVPPPPARSITIHGDGKISLAGFPSGIVGVEQAVGFVEIHVRPDLIKKSLISQFVPTQKVIEDP